MSEEQDPALSPEGAFGGAGAGADEADPQANAESSAEAVDGAGAGESAPQNNQDGASEELEIVFADEGSTPQKDATAPWVKELRKEHRELKAQKIELERKLAALVQPAGPPDPGPEPMLEDEDIAYDQAALKAKHATWLAARERKAAFDAKAAQDAEAAQAKERARVQAYVASRATAAARFPEYEDRERRVMAVLDVPRQHVIVKYAKDPTLVVAAIGQNPSLADDLRTEEDPLLYVARLRELEAKLSTKPKSKTPPAPEKKISGSGSSSATADAHLEKLRAQADKTRDRTPVIEYLRNKREQQR